MDLWGPWDHWVPSHLLIRWPNSKVQGEEPALGSSSCGIWPSCSNHLCGVTWGSKTTWSSELLLSIALCRADEAREGGRLLLTKCHGQCLAYSLSLEPLAFSCLPHGAIGTRLLPGAACVAGGVCSCPLSGCLGMCCK